jgi:pimeloyl-ACP methyl ester carboxylesterase
MQMDSPDRYFETAGARLRYRDEGHGPAVLLVHGWTLDLDMWNAQAAYLSDAFRIVRLDRRGFGLSSGRPSVTSDGTDLKALCEHLGLDSAALVGMSQGARAVMQFAASFPEATSCVILDGAPGIGTGQVTGGTSEIPYEHYRELVKTRGLPAFLEEWGRHALVRLRTQDPNAHALLARMLSRYPGADLTDTAPPGLGAPSDPDIQAMNQPVLVINGEFDLDSRRQSGNQFVSQLRRVEYGEIPDAGHLCNLDNPHAYNQVLRRFLERHATPANQPMRSIR